MLSSRTSPSGSYNVGQIPQWYVRDDQRATVHLSLQMDYPCSSQASRHQGFSHLACHTAVEPSRKLCTNYPLVCTSQTHATSLIRESVHIGQQRHADLPRRSIHATKVCMLIRRLDGSPCAVHESYNCRKFESAMRRNP